MFVDRIKENGYCVRYEAYNNMNNMRNDLLNYLAGLCQAASAALLASAVIMPDVRVDSLIICVVSAVLGGIFIILKENT